MSQHGNDSGDNAPTPQLPTQSNAGEIRVVRAEDVQREVQGQAAEGSSFFTVRTYYCKNPNSFLCFHVLLVRITTKQSFVAKPTQEFHGPRLFRKNRAEHPKRACNNNKKQEKTSLQHTPITETECWREKEKTTWHTKTLKKRKDARRATAIAKLQVSAPQSTKEGGATAILIPKPSSPHALHSSHSLVVVLWPWPYRVVSIRILPFITQH